MVADQSASISAASWTLGSVSIIVVGLRLYTRLFLTRLPGWDDFFIALSLASALVCSSLAQVAVSYGLGIHTDDIASVDDRVNAAKYTVIAPNFSVVSTTTGKISVAIFLLRLIGQSAKTWQRWFLYILTMVSIAWNVFAIIVIIGFCRPPEKIWLPETPGSCFSLQLQLVGGTSQAAFNAFADLALAFFPVIIFYKIQLPTYKKVGIVAILGAGVLQMYVIIICATLPTLPQCYTALMHKRQTYNNTSNCRSSKPGSKQTPIRLQRMPDASLFETAAGDREGSQENILEPGQINITKTTEVRVIQEGRGHGGTADDPRYFPRQNPFRSSQQS
ncbi:hypothetical protein BJX76DRAFT_364175 [Aspergillus varians]